ncbi:hypothetical protein V1505DRAFT_382175 [Lipomyces doorenjongii]
MLALLSSTPNTVVIIGVDAEWNRGSDSADLVQLTFKDTVVLIRLYRMRECPIRLQQLRTSPALMKVGCRVNGDFTRIVKIFLFAFDGWRYAELQTQTLSVPDYG